MPKFSIIMQCYLGSYPNAASDRENKLIRAIDSIISQTYKEWELIVIADGCEKTFEIVSEKYANNNKVDCRLIQKQIIWGGGPRNYGISQAKGEYIVYLDADDFFIKDHLQKIIESIGNYDWAYFNDFVKTKGGEVERECIINSKYQFGTSNIIHRRSLNAQWTSFGYANDDWGLVEHLKKLSKNYGKINGGYVVCHIFQKGIDV